jgi:hypothetical protein
MNIRKFFIFILLTLPFSQNVWANAGWSGKATITGLYALDNNKVLRKLSNFTNPAQCSVNSSGDFIINSSTHANWFSMLLIAYSASRTINVYTNGNCETVWANTSYAQVGHVRLL